MRKFIEKFRLRTKEMVNRDKQRDEVMHFDLDAITTRDLKTIIFGKIQLWIANSSKKYTPLALAMLCIIFGVCYIIFAPSYRQVSIPASYVPAGTFSSSSGISGNINALSVDSFVVTGIMEDLALRYKYGKFYKYLSDPEPTHIVPIMMDRIIDEKDGVYNMQLSAFLAVNKLLGTPKPYEVRLEIGSVGFPVTSNPSFLPSDVIVAVDNKLVTDEIEMTEYILDSLPHGVTFLRGDLVYHVVERLGGITLKKVIFLKNSEDYKEFEQFANLGLKGYKGSSAGSALALQYYVSKSGKDVTNARKVALTGTISETGKIGSIGGVKSKTILAIQNDSDILFVPKDIDLTQNYSDALSVIEGVNSSVKLVAVETFSEIIDYLSK